MPANLKDFFNDNRKTFDFINIIIRKDINSNYKFCPLFLFPDVSLISEVTSKTVKMR